MIRFFEQFWGVKKDPTSSQSLVVQTSLGPVECAVTGEGPAVLVIHGCPGGYDQGLIATKLANGQRFKFIAVSRPGYLGTPLSVGETPPAQADAYAALLDALSIPKAAIIGISGGGPSALQFGLRHPERCWAVATLCAISRPLTRAEIANCKSLRRRILFALNLILQLVRNFIGQIRSTSQGKLVRVFFPSMSKQAKVYPNEKDNLEIILGLLSNFTSMSLRKAGLQNDMRQLTTMSSYPLENIAAPVLVLHGKADDLVPFSHAEFIADRAPHSRILEIKDGGHLFFMSHRRLVVEAVSRFLEENAHEANSPSPRHNGPLTLPHTLPATCTVPAVELDPAELA